MQTSFIESFNINLAGPNVAVLAISLAANATSSYRDASNVSKLFIDKFGIKTTMIVTDNAKNIRNNPNVRIVTPINKVGFLRYIDEFVVNLPTESTLLFTLSAHGYTQKANRDRMAFEPDKRTE